LILFQSELCKKCFTIGDVLKKLMRLGDMGIDPEAMEWAQQALTGQVSDRSDGLCANAAGLLYVHAGIAMTDAMLIFLTKDRSTAQDHNEAVSKLQKECGRRQRAAGWYQAFAVACEQKELFCVR